MNQNLNNGQFVKGIWTVSIMDGPPSWNMGIVSQDTIDIGYLQFLEPIESSTKGQETFKSTMLISPPTKGQLVAECLLGVIDFPKNQRKIWQISALESKKMVKSTK